MNLKKLHNDIHEGALQLMAEHRVQLFAKAKSLCDNEDEANELVIRTIDQAIRKIDTYSGEGDILSWMMAILENLHNHDWRSPVVRGTTVLDGDELEKLVGADWSTDEQILKNSDGEAVRTALRQIDPEFKRLVLMRYYDEFTLREIANVLNMPISTVGRRMQMALRILAGKLEAEFSKAKPKLASLGVFLLAGSLFGAAAWGVVEAVNAVGSLGSEVALESEEPEAALGSEGTLGSLESEGSLGAAADPVDPNPDPIVPKDSTETVPSPLSATGAATTGAATLSTTENTNTKEKEIMNLKSITKSAAKLTVGAALTTGLAANADEAAGWTYDSNTLTENVEFGTPWVLNVSVANGALTVSSVAQVGDNPTLDLSEMAWPEGCPPLTTFAEMAFYGQKTIQELRLPETLRSIGEEAFYLCSGLKTVEPLLPSAVTTIGHYAFSGCLALKGDLSIGSVGGVPTSWKVPGSSRGTSQFDNCPKITSVVLHSATNVPGWCFQHDAAVTNVVFEGELAAIGESAFYDCPGIRSVTPLLPPSVTKIDKGAFQGCASLKGELVVGRPGGPVVEMASDVENEPNHFASTAIGSAVFHSVRIIPNECFHYCTSLTNVVLCEGIDRIGRYAFAACTALTTVTPFLPQSVRHVGGFAFYQCSNLSGNLFVGQRNKPLEWDSPGDPNRQWADHQFAEIFALKSVTIYGDIDEITKDCFCMDSALETVRIYSKTSVTVGDSAFGGWSGHTPPIRDFYANAFMTFGKETFRYYPDYTMRFWVARGNAQWDAWIAENVTPWNELGDVTNNFYTAFGAGARKPVGLVKDGVQPARQWVMRWSPGVGTMVLVR